MVAKAMKSSTSSEESRRLIADITEAVVGYDQERTRAAVDRVLKTAIATTHPHLTRSQAVECGCRVATGGREPEDSEPYCPRDNLGNAFRVYRGQTVTLPLHLRLAYAPDRIERLYGKDLFL